MDFIKNYKIYLIIALIFAIIVSYSLYQRARVAELKEQKHAIEFELKQKNAQLQQIEKDVETIKEVNKKLATIDEESYASLSELSGKLDKLERINKNEKAARRIEPLINNGAKERNRCFELATGAVPIKGEINKVCPNYLKGAK